MPDDGELTLRVDGKLLSGWQDVRVTCGVERMPSDFDIGVTERHPDALAEVFAKPGSECVVSIGGDVVVTGYVDRYQPSFGPRSHTVRLTGRGKCQDLVDCSADLSKWSGQLTGMTTKQLTERLCAPFGITVKTLDGDGAKIPQFNPILTEKPWDIIERIARFSGFLAYEDNTGALVLGRVGQGRMASGFRQAVNVESAAVSFAMDGRFSRYEAVYQSTDTLSDVRAAVGEPNSLFRGRVDDEAVPRHRPFVFVSEQMQYGQDLARQRAKWEMARRYGRSQAVRVTVDSWRDAAGKLWEPNTRASIDLPALRLPDREWIISEVAFQRGADGTRAEVVLMPEEAFVIEPTFLQPYDWQVARALQGGPGGSEQGSSTKPAASPS